MNSLYKNAARFGAVSLVLAASLASMHAQDTPRTERKSGPGEGLRRFLEGFGSSLDDDKREQLNRALEDFSKGLEEGRDQSGDSQRGRQSDLQEPRGNNESDRRRGRVERVPQEKPSTPRAQRQNQRPPGGAADQLRQQMEQMFPGVDPERFFGDDFFGPLLREMNRMQGSASEDEAEGPGGALPWMQGQKGNARNSRHEKAARRAMAEFRPVVKHARDSVVTLYGSRDEQLALGTIVTADGYALTKASALNDSKSVEAEFSDGRTVKAKVVDSLERYDLALLKLEADNLKPIEWNITENLPVGTLIAATSPDEDPLAIGVISVPARSLDSSRKGFLGVGMDGAEGGVKITNVSKKSAAEKVGLQVDDIITAIDGKPIRSPKELTDYITRKKAEDEVHIGYRRGTEDKVAVATLQSRDEMVLGTTASGEAVNESEFKRLQRESDPTARMGGRGNRIADGFPSALQNDLLIETNQVGGPAVDLDGKAIALNIARAERTKTYSIPATAVAQLLVNVQQGKLTEPKDSTDLKRDARKAEETLEELRTQLKEAEERARTAREALEKQVR
jgi:S1-C subfamily serine protease